MKNYLSNLKVIEVASVLAGPSVGMYFAERGSTVLKIENKRSGGDITRSWKLPAEDKKASLSAYFCSVNWGKQHIFLDLTNENELAVLKKEIGTADILITNFKSGDAQKFGLNFKQVSEINPQIIHGEISGFGKNNERLAYDLILQAETGFMSINGTEDSGPVKMPVAFIDLFAGHQLKEGILEALLERNINKKAYHVEVSLFDSAIASLANQASNYLMTGQLPLRIGSKHPNIAPYGEIFKTRDKKLMVFAIGSDSQFNTLFELLQLEISDQFSNNQNRLKNRSELESVIAQEVLKWSAETLYKTLIDKKVPVALIKGIDEVFDQKETSQLILSEDLEGVPTKRVKTSVYKISSST
ncbi:MAG: CaiB/BaiF CoA-transferase family protein [Crocinitomicaceae bacterium]